ncbi:MAG: glycosyltransferase family 2 protein [Nitrospira sp.]|nr:glycosyltransferase family 2 protein [Nitrospira sp.]MEB2338012.1 glycosyltransferase family 2 protein [Nitrospirales bacterium]QOJ36349.1 MAG: glycosyltransferase family 2 protein [Nitrospira sp.]
MTLRLQFPSGSATVSAQQRRVKDHRQQHTPAGGCLRVTLTSTQAPYLSVIVPAYNEAHRLPPTLQHIATHLTQRRLAYEILVVDDGSLDGTAREVESAALRIPQIRLIRLPNNMGKGAAVRHGMQTARGLLQLFTDADGATPIEEFSHLEQALEAGADLAIGSRALASRQPGYTVQARWLRSALGTTFNGMVQRLGLPLADTQCGFKLFRRSVAQDLFAVTCVNGYAFDLEVLYVAQRRGYRIAEVPVNWADQPGSKVRVWRDGFTMLQELLEIRRREAEGFYHPRSRELLQPIEPALASIEPSHP